MKKLLILFLLLSVTPLFGACSTEEEVRPTSPLELRMGGSFEPNDGGLTLISAWVVVGDLTLYGMDPVDPNLFRVNDPHKHAGHAHGEAIMETGFQETFMVDLLSDPVTVATVMAPQGHYFDGKLRLRPAEELYTPLFPDGTPLTSDHPMWGKTIHIEGFVTLDGSQIPFAIRGATELLVTGLEYAATVTEGGATKVTTLMDLNQILNSIDWESTTRQNAAIEISETSNPTIWQDLLTLLADYQTYIHLETEPAPVH